jgi:general L-amino acid transport system permease protein
MTQNNNTQPSNDVFAFFRDVRVIAIIAQLVFIVLFIGAVAFITVNINNSLIEQGIPPNMSFLSDRAGFDISEAPDTYSSNDSYWDAYVVGIINTLRVVIPGLVLSTVIGIFLGIALLSRNFMVKTVSDVYVEILRNTPLLVQLFFWYFVVVFSMPPPLRAQIAVPTESVFWMEWRIIAYPIAWIAILLLSTRYKFPINFFSGALWGAVVFEIFMRLLNYNELAILAGGAIAVGVIFYALNGNVQTQIKGYLYGGGAIVAVQLLAFIVVSGLVLINLLPSKMIFWEVHPVFLGSLQWFALPSISFENGFQFILPDRQGARILAGTVFTPEFMALFVGLVVYTSAFIGEIVRAGIQAVPYGQIEASRALGLSGAQTLRLVVLPQALRVIIPPLGNQYLNLAKNSTLATVVAFSDAYSVGLTVMNTSGQGVTTFALILLTYLTMSLTIATMMAFVNSQFQLRAR